MNTLLALFHSLAQRMRRAARERRARDAFNCLDDAALRDLGLTRGEFASYWREASLELPVTRRRVRAGHSAACRG